MYPASSNFWSASDRYFGRVASATAGKPADVYQQWIAGSQPPNKGKRYRTMPPSRYSAALATPSKAQAIRTDPRFRAEVLDVIAMTAPTVTAEMDQALGGLALNAFKKWPIKSGFSKGMVFLEYTPLGPGKLKGSVGNGAWYAFYIKPIKLGRKNAWQSLIVKPSKKVLRDMAERIADDLSTPGSR